MLLVSRRPWLEVCGGELWRRETFEEEDANGVGKVKGIFCRAKKETAKEQLLVTRRI